MQPFSNSLEHLLAELERLDFRVRFHVWHKQRLDESPLAGLPADNTEGESAWRLPSVSFSSQVAAAPWLLASQSPAGYQELDAELQHMAEMIAGRLSVTCQAGRIVRLTRLGELFGLGRFEQDLLLLCLAPELDSRFAHLYAYLQDDPARQAPTAGLAVQLLCSSLEERSAAWAALAPAAALRRWPLLRWLPAFPGAPSLSQQPLQIEDRIRDYLLEQDGLDRTLLPYASLALPTAPSGPLLVNEELLDGLHRLAIQPGPQVLYLHGADPLGVRMTANALARRLGRPLLAPHSLPFNQPLHLPDFLAFIRLVEREARLAEALLFWPDFDLLFGEAYGAALQAAAVLLSERSLPTLLAGRLNWSPGGLFVPAAFSCLSLPFPPAAERRELWERALSDLSPVGERAESGSSRTGLPGDLDLESLANGYRLSTGQIAQAAASAVSLARQRQTITGGSPSDFLFEQTDLLAASRQHAGHRLAALAQKIAPHYGWDDIILPAIQAAQLRELCDQVHYRTRVLEAWGFERKLALGKGLNALFTGPPGAGKTMAADILAGALDLDLYKIDLSSVVSKYIGETEKNLAHIFADAGAGNAILFFDEADALFGKRSDVKDAHDRYANLEISYLLQKIEEYDGVVILATNLRQNLDRAFLRRMRFIIDFPFPDAADRRRIWEGIWPDAAPLAADLDLDALARQFEISGGSIRSIALAAAFLAAADESSIAMRHVLRAAEAEYRKIGKPV